MKYVLQSKNEQFSRGGNQIRIIHTLVEVTNTVLPSAGVTVMTLPEALPFPAGTILDVNLTPAGAIAAAPQS